jgi:hypothetical protein
MRMMMKSMMAGALVSLATLAVAGVANAVPLGTCGGPGLPGMPANMLGSFVNPATGLGNGNSCTVGDKTFSNFSYNLDGTNVPLANVGLGTAPSPDPGLLFTGAWAGSASGRTDAFFDFTVTAPAATPITDASLQVLNGSGNFREEEDFLGTGLNLVATNTVLQRLDFAPPGFLVLNVSNDLALLDATANVSAFEKQFSQGVPEPASLAILGFSLLGMGAVYRRFRK